MNEQQRAQLLEIAALVAEFAHKPTPQALATILDRLRDLIRDVQVSAGGIVDLDDGTKKYLGYDGIELTGLRMVSAILKRELTQSVDAGPSVTGRIAAVCSEQAQAMRLLAGSAPPPGLGRAQSPGRGEEGVPDTTLAIQACVIDVDRNECFLSHQPDARAGLYGFTTSIAFLRDAGVTFLGLTGFADLPAAELSWLCGAARRVFSVFSISAPNLCCNIEVSAGQHKLYFRLVMTEDRALFLSYETRTVRRPHPPGASVQQLKQALRSTYRLGDITDAGTAWTLEELLEVQAAFAKIPLPDREALVNLGLIRESTSQVNRPDAAQHRGYYDPPTHTLTILDGAFADLSGFGGSGPEAIHYSHFVILHEIGHAVEKWYRVQVPGSQLAGALDLFVAKTHALGVQAFTIYSWNNWPAKPFEFFAEAYTYFLNDPGAMEFVSHKLLMWFRHGGYRVARNGTGIVPHALTEHLRELLDSLDGLCVALTAAPSAEQKTVLALRTRCSGVLAQLAELISGLDDRRDARIEHTILISVSRVFEGEVVAVLAPSTGVLPPFSVFAVVKDVCLRERATLATLLNDAPAPVVADHRRVTSAVCTVLTPSNGAAVVRGGRGGELVVRPLTRAMAALREFGFTALTLDNCHTLSNDEIPWLCNVAAKVFLDCGAQFALSVNVSVSVPRRTRPLLVRFVFLAGRGLWIRFECEAPAPAGQPPSVAVSMQLLLRSNTYGVTAVSEANGGAWTADELAQVCDAFARVPAADRRVLRRCTLVRSGSPVPAGGSYDPVTHSLILSNAAFAGVEGGFHGGGDTVFPLSHWTVLRLVGQAAAMCNWEWDDEPPLTESMCLRPFGIVATQVGFAGSITLDAPHSPLGVFADAYALNLCEPLVMAWISPGLQAWFARGSYRQSLG